MAGRNFLSDVFTGPIGPFARVVIIVALGASAGSDLTTVLNPPDTEDRYRGAEAERDWEEHKAIHKEDKADLERAIIASEARINARLDALLAAFGAHLEDYQGHLEHSAEWTRVIKDDHEDQKDIERRIRDLERAR